MSGAAVHVTLVTHHECHAYCREFGLDHKSSDLVERLNQSGCTTRSTLNLLLVRVPRLKSVCIPDILAKLCGFFDSNIPLPARIDMLDFEGMHKMYRNATGAVRDTKWVTYRTCEVYGFTDNVIHEVYLCRPTPWSDEHLIYYSIYMISSDERKLGEVHNGDSVKPVGVYSMAFQFCFSLGAVRITDMRHDPEC